ncbi:hypothetical protein Vadar_028821 [Vaccinium darrowii]|uniref:Uncharacterized protein n=1 Tax=Vaccinium darrowii TaxID=229202 RepID=A0ACB7X507_9ERIC|nr:hypothetical protein Vadar_028821 [Vaccinium darrowii]
MNHQPHNQPPPPPVMGVPIAPEPPRAELISIKDFQKMKPPMFGGGIDPSRADDWELGMEKIFAVMTPAQCPEMHKVKLSGKRTYTDVLNVALMVEEEQAKVRGSDGGQQPKRINYVSPKDQRGASSFKKRNTNTSGWSQGGSSGSGSGSQLCPKCGRMHRGPCYRDMGACFKCGAVGHMMKNCPTWAKQSVATPTATISSGQSTGTKLDAGRKQARAFALIPGDPESANSVVSVQPVLFETVKQRQMEDEFIKDMADKLKEVRVDTWTEVAKSRVP